MRSMLLAGLLALGLSAPAAADTKSYLLGMEFQTVATGWEYATACQHWGVFRDVEIEALKARMMELGAGLTEQERNENWTMVQTGPGIRLLKTVPPNASVCFGLRNDMLEWDSTRQVLEGAQDDFPFD